MTNSRNKGLRFELQVASLLDDELGIKLHRDLEQTRTADHGDLVSSDPSWPFCIECKRYATGYLPKKECTFSITNQGIIDKSVRSVVLTSHLLKRGEDISNSCGENNPIADYINAVKNKGDEKIISFELIDNNIKVCMIFSDI